MANNNTQKLVYVNTLPKNNENVSLEDLNIFVELEVVTSSRTYITKSEKGNSVNNRNGIKYSFISKQKKNKDKLTTDYTELTGRNEDGDELEGLGITNIEISFNSSYAPIIKIDFVDIRGGSIFNKNAKNKNEVFFLLPYPLFRLTVKGYYGDAVSYCLHLTRVNSKFNPDTGNFEIYTEFIGYTYALLVDILYPYMKAIVKTEKGKSLFNEYKKFYPNLQTINELLSNIDKYDSVVQESLRNDDDFKLLNRNKQVVEELKNFKIDITNKSSISNGAGINIDLFDFKNNIFAYRVNKGGVDNLNYDISYKTFLNSKLELLNNSITPKIIFDLQYNIFPIKDSEFANSENENIIIKRTTNLDTLLKDIDNRIDILESNIFDLDLKVNEGIIRNLTNNNTELPKPTLQYIMEVLTLHAEIFLAVLYDVSVEAERSSDRNVLLKRRLNNTSSGQKIAKIGKIYAFPDYINNSKEDYLGDLDDKTTPKITETIFIEELLQALIDDQTEEKQILNNINNPYGYKPVNPIDTLLYNNTTPYNNELTDFNIVRLMLNRFLIFNYISNDYRNVTSEEIKELAKSEYDLIINNTSKVDILKNLKEVFTKENTYDSLNTFLSNNRNNFIGDITTTNKDGLVYSFGLSNGELIKSDSFKNPNLFISGKVTNSESNLILNSKDLKLNRVAEFLSYTDIGSNTTYFSSKQLSYDIGTNTYDDTNFQFWRIIKNDIELKGLDSIIGINNEEDIFTKFYKDYTEIKSSAIDDTNKFINKIKSKKISTFLFSINRSINNTQTIREYGNIINTPFYTQQNDKGKVLLILHSLPFYNFLSEYNEVFADNNNKTNNNFLESCIYERMFLELFNKKTGVSKVPKLYLYLLGGLLDRFENGEFLITNQSGNTTINNTNVLVPTVDSYLQLKNSKGNRVGIFMGNGEYLRLPLFLRNLPKQIKNLLITEFNTFANNEFLILKSLIENSNNYDGELIKENSELNTFLNNIVSENYYVVNNSVLPFINLTNNNDDDCEFTFSFAAIAGTSFSIPSVQTLSSLKNNIVSLNFLSKNSNDETIFLTYLTELGSLFNDKDIENEKNKVDEKIKNTNTVTNDKFLKLNVYRTLKSINDKWISNKVQSENNKPYNLVDFFDFCGGFIEDDCNDCNKNVIDKNKSSKRPGDRVRLIDSFRFLDKSFREIGDEFLINPRKLSNILNTQSNRSLYDIITKVLSDNYFDFVPLPSFVDFTNEKELKNVFTPKPYGFFTVNSSPSFICVYNGQSSKHLDLETSIYENDSFDLENPPNFLIGDKKNTDSTAAAFSVDYGHQNQSIFRGFGLDQREFTETDESLQIISALADGDINPFIGQNLYNVYEVRSYSATIEMLGCAQIQPMMYFQLNNVPMFYGAYLIIKVDHTITPNHMKTTFKGVRVTKYLPKLAENSFIYLNELKDITPVDTTGIKAGIIENKFLLNQNELSLLLQNVRFVDPYFVGNGISYRVNSLPQSSRGRNNIDGGETRPHNGTDLQGTLNNIKIENRRNSDNAYNGSKLRMIANSIITDINIINGGGLSIAGYLLDNNSRKYIYTENGVNYIYVFKYMHLIDLSDDLLKAANIDVNNFRTDNIFTPKTGLNIKTTVVADINKFIAIEGGKNSIRISSGGLDFSGASSGEHLHIELLKVREDKANGSLLQSTSSLVENGGQIISVTQVLPLLLTNPTYNIEKRPPSEGAS